jgi:hypothetical protein
MTKASHAEAQRRKESVSFASLRLCVRTQSSLIPTRGATRTSPKQRHVRTHAIGRILAAFCWASAGFCSLLPADDRFPLRQHPIDYFGESTNNVVAELAARLERGETRLEFDDGSPQGYLWSVLKHLDIPVESQVLTFTAAARNAQHVRYEQPRAIYFSDEATVGYVPGTPELELTAFDPDRGTVFYTLRQLAGDRPRIEREDDCLQCHVSPATTRGVSGLILSSLVVSADGKSSKLVPLRRDLEPAERFGAWFVTGDVGPGTHRGNDRLGSTVWSTMREKSPEREQPVSLPVELPEGRYPSRESDVAALLVLSHIVEVHNLTTRLRYEGLLGRPTDETEERLLRELTGADELFPDQPEVSGSGVRESAPSGFQRTYESGGPLRTLDLRRRLFRYRLSPLRLSRVVSGLPEHMLARLDRRIELILEGRVDAPPFDTWPESERVETLKAWRAARKSGAETPRHER